MKMPCKDCMLLFMCKMKMHPHMKNTKSTIHYYFLQNIQCSLINSYISELDSSESWTTRIANTCNEVFK